MASLMIGYSTSYTSPALVSMQDNTTATFEVTMDMVSRKVQKWICEKKKRSFFSIVDKIIFKQTCFARMSDNLEHFGETKDNVIWILFLSKPKTNRRSNNS